MRDIESLKRMKFLSLGVVVFLVMLVSLSLSPELMFSDVSAQTQAVNAKSTAFEETTVIEFTNEGNSEISMFRIWLGEEVNFKSFKAEDGWIGKKNPQGVIVFTSPEQPVMPGESVKFGIKTDKEKPGINWKALDENDEQLGIGKAVSIDLSQQREQQQQEEKEQQEEKDNTESNKNKNNSGILSDSVFRLVPEKPKVGSTIRVIGDNFGPNKELGFFIDKQKLEDFETDENGKFIITTKIPSDIQADSRVEFIVKDNEDNQKNVSLRLGEGVGAITDAEEIKLTTKGIPDSIYRGEKIEMTGTAAPGTTVTINIKDPDDKVTTTNATEADQRGNWSFSKIISMDLGLGQYTIEITNEKQKITESVEIESSEKINVAPSKVKYSPGDIIRFNGTGIPNERIELILEDPQGNEIASDVLSLNETGKFEFEYPTVVSTAEGTYALFAVQGNEETIALAGLGQVPEEHMTIRMNDLNYKSTDTAELRIHGSPSSTVNLLIVDPADNEKHTDVIQLGPQGSAEYELKLSGYASGVYTAVVTRGGSQASETFTVGLQTGSGDIELRTTKQEYKPGDPILVLGNANKNVLIFLTLVDPDGETIKQREAFTNKEGILSEGNFRVPSEAAPGTWSIRAESGANFATVEFKVNPTQEEGMVVWIEDVQGTVEKTKKIAGVNAEGGKVFLNIISSEGEIISELTLITKGNGEFSTFWSPPEETPSGNYKVEVEDPLGNTAETTMEL